MERKLTFIFCIVLTIALLCGYGYMAQQFAGAMEKKITAALDGRVR